MLLLSCTARRWGAILHAHDDWIRYDIHDRVIDNVLIDGSLPIKLEVLRLPLQITCLLLDCDASRRLLYNVIEA